MYLVPLILHMIVWEIGKNTYTFLVDLLIDNRFFPVKFDESYSTLWYIVICDVFTIMSICAPFWSSLSTIMAERPHSLLKGWKKLVYININSLFRSLYIMVGIFNMLYLFIMYIYVYILYMFTIDAILFCGQSITVMFLM